MRIGQLLVALFTAGAVIACTSGGGGGGSGRGGDASGPSGGETKLASPPESPPFTFAPSDPTPCLSGDACVADVDCPSGHHCNTALSPPKCQKLYCGKVGTRCSEAALCETGYECRELKFGSGPSVC